MCLSKAFYMKNGKKEVVAEDIASVHIENGKLVFRSLFGEQKQVQARISEIDFVGNGIRLEDVKEGVQS